ncbi:hypothetical protein [Acidiphilium acidophilum]|uniref:Uncharacterized protein n=1 Tax=Acidiphilium acidophilum TaxID=76588 RepID=A0AAW9DNJ9_ACIAO|nr:hypothetical protein [Acidiphilium acidophilum]MDX5930486.1 hypothetical protein [Acidiphilium acidophilum]
MSKITPDLTEAHVRCLSALVALIGNLMLAICDAADLPSPLRRLIETHIATVTSELAALIAAHQATTTPHAPRDPASAPIRQQPPDLQPPRQPIAPARATTPATAPIPRDRRPPPRTRQKPHPVRPAFARL